MAIENLPEICPADKTAARREKDRQRKAKQRERERHQQLVVFDRDTLPAVTGVTPHISPSKIEPSVTAADVTPGHGRRTRDSRALKMLAYGLALVGLGINGWFAWNRGTAPIDRALFAGLGLLAEATMFFLPARAADLWRAQVGRLHCCDHHMAPLVRLCVDQHSRLRRHQLHGRCDRARGTGDASDNGRQAQGRHPDEIPRG
jgi:hypothetical protein